METNPWLSEDEQRVWRTYLRAHWLLAGVLHRRLQTKSTLSLADYGVLVFLSEAPEGRMRPFELERSLQWEQSRLSHQLRRMEKRDLVSRRMCTADKRGSFIEITDEGRGAIEAAAPNHVLAVRSIFFDGLTPEQIGTLEEVSDRIIRRIEEYAEPEV